jgi:hypothetical protein
LTDSDGGWSLVPGKVDGKSWWLLVFFVAVLLFLKLFEIMIPGVSS